MKTLLASIGIIALLLFIGISCTKQDDSNSEIQAELVGKKGQGNGNGGGSTSPSTNIDSLNASCGMVLTDTGCWYPVIQLRNLHWYKHIAYSYNPATGLNDHPYEVLMLSFDAPVIAGKTIRSYMLSADQCSMRVVCNGINGIPMSQVTTGNPTTTFALPVATTWLNPSVQQYTGVIQIITNEWCMYVSQPFTFEPPRYL